MADWDISTSTRSSRSRTSTTSRSRTGSSTSSFRSTASSSGAETETFIPTNSPSATGLVTASVPVQTESTNSLASPTSAPTSNASDNGGGPKPPVAAIAVSTILGVLVIGVVAFLLISRRRRRKGESPYITRHEPKRRDTHPQPTIQESSLYLASKESENEKEPPMSPSSSSLDSDIIRSPKSKLRSSRASSSIFIDDRDDVTISSRSNNFRPSSFGEPLPSRGLQSPPSATSQPTPLFDRLNSNRVDPERQLPTIPGTPATPRFAFFSAEEQDGEALIAQTPPPEVITLSRTTTRNSNRSNRSSRSKTRNFTPPTPTSTLPPSPPPPIPLPPLPNSSDDLSKRASTNTLTAPVRPGLGDSRPLSMQSAYSFQSQTLSPNYSGALSPDILATLERLKKRISTPWSINSVDSYGFNRTSAAPTEEA